MVPRTLLAVCLTLVVAHFLEIGPPEPVGLAAIGSALAFSLTYFWSHRDPRQ